MKDYASSFGGAQDRELVERHPDQSTVDRAFCKAKCAAFHDSPSLGEWCGTIYAPKERNGKCLWPKPKLQGQKE